ncbi:MAG TPA: hypothetical protein VFV75_03800 [Candidatus Polarisedimenticolaceae bacterium]|nr:hypothetical protein [Candidatus Polarisedimenticolaceae bacterium]
MRAVTGEHPNQRVLRRLDEADIPVASATFEVVGVPTLHVRQENR